MSFLRKNKKKKKMGRIILNGKEIDYTPYIDKISMERLKIRLMQEKSFVKVFTTNQTDNFMSSMRDVVDPKVRHEENSVWEISGLSGSGKSETTISLAKELTPDRFSADNVAFYDKQILDKAKDLLRDSFIIRDEAVPIFGVGSHKMSVDMNVLAETSRKAGINLVFISPREQNIEIAKWLLQTVDIDYKNRITRMALKDPLTQQYLGAVYVKVLPADDPIIINYNKKKDEFIESIREGKRSDAKTDLKSIAKEIFKKIDLEIFSKKKERLAYIQTECDNLTNAEIGIVHTFIEILVKSGGDALDVD